MKPVLRRLRTVTVTLATCTLGLSLLSAPAAAGPVQPVTPLSDRAPESDQFSAEGVTTVGELRTVGGSLSYARDGRTQIIQHPGATYIKVHFSSLRLAPGEYVTVSSRTAGRATGTTVT